MTLKKKIHILIAGGKTGGHLFPGIAIAEALLRINPETNILFVGTDNEFEIKTLDKYNFMHESIPSTGIKGKNTFQKIQALFQIPLSIVKARKLIKKFAPDLVIGVGGYASGPVVLCARISGIPTAIQEQNSIPGITNRILAWIVHTIFTSFKETKFKDFSKFFNDKKIIYTGNPIRKIHNNHGPNFLLNNENKTRFTILVTGGSQGAKSINTAFLDAMKQIKRPERFRIIHQTGFSDEKRIKDAYAEMGISAETKAFFHDMTRYQAMADLILCRAGAGTISEITWHGKPSILVPYPYAADDHQTENAKALVHAEAAWLILDRDLSGEVLKNKIEFAQKNPELMSHMSARAKEMAMPDADEKIARHCIQMALSNT